MTLRLTRDSDALICLLYKHYCQQLKRGISKSDAKQFGGSPEIHKSIAPKWTFENVDETCKELSRAGLLNCYCAENIVWDSSLSDEGIIYMENRFKDGLKDVLEYLEKIRNILPI